MYACMYVCIFVGYGWLKFIYDWRQCALMQFLFLGDDIYEQPGALLLHETPDDRLRAYRARTERRATY